MNNDTLVQKIKSGEGDVLKDLYIKYREEFVIWLSANYSCSVDDAKDIYQISILDLYENVLANKLVHLKSSFKTYLFAIGKNKILEQKKRMSKVSDLNEMTDYKDLDDGAEMRSEALMKNANLDMIEEALNKMSDPCKTLLRQFYYYRKNLEQIAAQMEYKNTDTVKNLKYKCMKRLRKIFYTHLTPMRK